MKPRPNVIEIKPLKKDQTRGLGRQQSLILENNIDIKQM